MVVAAEKDDDDAILSKALPLFSITGARAMQWVDRLARLEALALDETLAALLSHHDGDLGLLLDRAQLTLASDQLDGASDHGQPGCGLEGPAGNERELLAHLVDLALHPEDDFRVEATFDQSGHSRVRSTRGGRPGPG
jgi:hypothetical protein